MMSDGGGGEMMSDGGGAAASGPYDVLMVDPPWPVGGRQYHSGRWQTQELPYGTLTWTALWGVLEAEVFAQMSPHHALFLWTLEQLLTDTEAALVDRGYRRTQRLIWDKGAGPLIGGAGIQRRHEYLLWYCKPTLLHIDYAAGGKFGSLFQGPRREHSRKPSAAYALVEALYPAARKLDAFTRELRPGWDGWGHERDAFTPLLAPLREGEVGSRT